MILALRHRFIRGVLAVGTYHLVRVLPGCAFVVAGIDALLYANEQKLWLNCWGLLPSRQDPSWVHQSFGIKQRLNTADQFSLNRR